VRTYEGVRANPRAVFDRYSAWQVNKDAYLEVRGLRPADVSEAAAQFIYLNKTAWNGLYRVNRSGQFNVPFGLPKSSNIVALDALTAAAALLKRATINHGDFEQTLSTAEPNDLVFVDPPYVTAHNDNGFVHYNETLFSWSDQERLARRCADLRENGVHVIVTNAAHASVRDLYAGFYVTEITRHSTLAGNPAKRRSVKELIFSTQRPREA
jgi:DNA adenine methylase